MGKLQALVAFILAAALAAVGAVVVATPARAQDCPGNPDALGTSRVLVLEGNEPARIGVMQYPDSLPLADKEVVLTFDDGPLPRYTDQVLDILAAQCVKATFFMVGRMAQEFPATARRVYEAGHTVGTHSEDHPSRFGNLPIERMRREIDRGIADVGAALGDPRDLAPFFRVPGLARSDTVERELAARSLTVFSSDAVADDWHHRIKPGQIITRAMSRLEKRGKGILLLHDIHGVTVAALPGLLHALKEQGFHLVHIMAGEQPGRIETVDQRTSAPREAMRPDANAGTPPDRIALPLPDIAAFDAGYRPEQGLTVVDGSDAVAKLPAPNVRDLGILLGGLEGAARRRDCDRTSPRPSWARRPPRHPETDRKRPAAGSVAHGDGAAIRFRTHHAPGESAAQNHDPHHRAAPTHMVASACGPGRGFGIDRGAGARG